MAIVLGFGRLLDAIGFARRLVPPPSAHYVTADDLVVISSRTNDPTNTTRITVRARILLASGRVMPWSAVHVDAGDRTLVTTAHQLREGFLLGLLVEYSSGSAGNGRCYVSVALGVGQEGAVLRTQGLVADYLISTGPGLTWPGGPWRSNLEGPGAIRLVDATPAGAGLDGAATVPSFTYWQVIGAEARLDTDATAINRLVFLDFSVTTEQLYFSRAVAVTAANALLDWRAGINVHELAALNAIAQLPIPDRVIVPGGGLVRWGADNFQAGDQWLEARFVVREWQSGTQVVT